MKAAIFVAAGEDLRLEEVESLPPGPTDVHVRIDATALCQTDAAVRRGDHHYGSPVLMGHEASGTVLAVGSHVSGLRVGDTVISSSAPSCGRCHHCAAGRPHICILSSSLRSVPRARRADGSVATALFGLGTFAEEMTVDQASLVAIDTEQPPESLALIGCGVTTGLSTVLNRTQLSHGGTLAVIGCGTVGLAAILGGGLKGAATIIAIDPNPARRDDARRRGATHALDSAEGDLVETVRAATGGLGVDATIDAVGAPATVAQAQAITRRAGEIVVVGMPPADGRFELAALPFFLSEQRLSSALFGSSQIRRDFPAFVRLAETGRLDLAGFISRTLSLDEVNAGLDALSRGEILRAVIRPGR
ncbi:zinc-binding dehydrogenase [Sphingopyxis sp. DBS4]|jgi:S-(hydroxymethyl)glutathione dehydrogenase/alcohol dehydrogenase|uniref:zinc-binding dehydrogenase n=1 Tax=Sphingopyxis sp. DBS4 TaxID=2968500 RepID=UPI00214C6125|nr:zinc-binding dehydrogenase [Sphingopyxis sp. DBS4]